MQECGQRVHCNKALLNRYSSNRLIILSYLIPNSAKILKPNCLKDDKLLFMVITDMGSVFLHGALTMGKTAHEQQLPIGMPHAE